MAEHAATVTWHLAPRAEFSVEGFNRDHEWTFPGGEVVAASASPDFSGTITRVNPEAAVVASLSSCHMLTFLALAAKQGLRVLSYVDSPAGTLEKNAEGATALTRINLRPRVVFADDAKPSSEAFDALHADARAHCFVANSLKSEIVLEPVSPDLD